MLERLIKKSQDQEEGKMYNLEDCEIYGCPNCNKLIQEEVLNPEILYVNLCSKCNNEFMVLKSGEVTKSLCTKNLYKEEAKNKYSKETEGKLYIVKDLPGYVSFESKEAASRVWLMFYEVFDQSKNIKTLEKKYCISKFQIKADEGYPNYLCLKFEYSAFKTINFLNILNALVKENDNIITKEIIQKALDIKLSVLNLWKFECIRKLEDMFSFEEIIKAAILFEQNKLYVAEITNFQNLGLYMGTILHICSCIEKYSKEEDLKEQYMKQVIKALNQIYSYLSSSNFDFCEDVNKKAKLENIICLIQIMLVADFE